MTDPLSMDHAAAAMREGREVPQGKSTDRLVAIRGMLDRVRYEEVRF